MRALTFALVLTLALAAACSNEQKATNIDQTAASQTTAKAADLTPEQLGELGAQIRKEPSRAEEILAKQGLNAASFEKAIRDVTENPESSKRYAEAYRKASA